MGRTTADAPEIDGIVEIELGEYEVFAGDFIEVDIVDATEHDLHAVIPDDE